MIDEGEFYVIGGGALLILVINQFFGYRPFPQRFTGRLMWIARGMDAMMN